MNEFKESKSDQKRLPRLPDSLGMGQGTSIDMNQVVGKMDILFICLDTLRYDVAVQEEVAGTTPVQKGQFGVLEITFRTVLFCIK